MLYHSKPDHCGTRASVSDTLKPMNISKNTEPMDDTDFPAYSDTVYSDTPLTVTVLTVPNWPFVYKKDMVTVTPLLQ